MSPGAAIAFLIAGPATTVPAMAAVWTLVRPRIFVLYVGIVVVGGGARTATDVVLQETCAGQCAGRTPARDARPERYPRIGEE